MKILNVFAIAAMAVLTTSPAFADTGSIALIEPGTLVLLAGGVATALLIRRRGK